MRRASAQWKIHKKGVNERDGAKIIANIVLCVMKCQECLVRPEGTRHGQDASSNSNELPLFVSFCALRWIVVIPVVKVEPHNRERYTKGRR